MQSLNGKKKDVEGQIYAQTRYLKEIKGYICKVAENTAELDIDFSPIVDAISELLVEIENNIHCSISKACNADTCEVITCKVCNDVEGVTVSTELYIDGLWIPDTEFTGTLDIGCLSCSEPIPTYEVFTKEVCFEDCSKGCIVYKLNTATNEVTPVVTLNSSGLPTELPTGPCAEIITLKNPTCVPDISIPDDIEFIPLKDCPK